MLGGIMELYEMSLLQDTSGKKKMDNSVLLSLTCSLYAFQIKSI